MNGLVLFDIDGTMLRVGDKDHQQALVLAMREVFGVPVDLNGVPLAGMLDSQIARLALMRQEVEPEEIRAGLPRVMESMSDHYARLIEGQERRGWVLPGVRNLAARLGQSAALAVMTGNARGVARSKLRAAELAEHFPIGSYGDSADERHELVDVAIQAAWSELGVRYHREQTVIVGDTPRDIQAAREAGVSIVAVGTGRFSTEVLNKHEPDLVFEDLSDVDRVESAVLSLMS